MFINNCETMNVLGVRMEGGMTEEISHPVKYLHKVPSQLGWDQAAMIEPLSISLHVVHRAAVKAGEPIVITGAASSASAGIAQTVRPRWRRLKKWRTNAATSRIATSTSHARGWPHVIG